MVFISCEGLDGSGKDTVVSSIKGEWPDTVVTSEPTVMWTGERVREALSDETSPPEFDFYLFMADRVKHVKEVIQPSDKAGRLVVSNRYADSTRAYQPVALEQAGVFESQWEAKNFIEHTMRAWDYEPDLTIYLDVSVETALERTSGKEKFENAEFLRQVRLNYEALLDANDRFVRVDAERPMDEVRESVRAIVAENFK